MNLSGSEVQAILGLLQSPKATNDEVQAIMAASCSAAPSLQLETQETAAPAKNCRSEWTAAEDGRLLAAVQKFGARKWKSVASEVRTRNQQQCQARFTKALRPGLRKGYWKQEEDHLLVKMVETNGTDWPEIADKWNADSSVQTRSVKQIRERW